MASPVSPAPPVVSSPITTPLSYPSTTKQKGGNTSQRSVTPVTTPAPISPTKRVTSAGTTTKDTTRKSSTAGGDIIGIIIFIVIIILVLVFGISCYITRRRGRRYSVDFTARPDEANIPLSTIDPDLPGDTVPQNGLQTFESVEPTTKEPQEPEAKPEVQEEQTTEADKPVVDPSAESAAPAPSPDSSEDKPKEDVVEQSPPAPVQPSTEEKTDDEGAVSNKTSVESLKEANGNNSNNADLSLKRDLESGYIFLDIPLDSQV
ncbi:uncharacterized protein si:dkey-27h10.2 isoform X2 [Lates calcarifer]|uniref:Uncharacterized protein si:dkey-27h10.2 isoform X2 n=1 Tax=Lates calcarifer TaxID=8187 RepID=A0AAJ7VCE2_LATCA|nr:uncharacterized protein si:dkey-27h10.2 isoform X2 [Lates calcarifer]